MENKPVKPIIFTDYNKISDTLLWLQDNNMKYQLKFNVILNKKDSNNKSFHTEFKIYNNNTNSESLSIKREYKYFYSLEKVNGDFLDNILLRSNDIEILKILITKKIYPWYFDSMNSIYGIDNNNNLCIKKKVRPVNLILSDTSYIKFTPCVYCYGNEDFKQGTRIEINNYKNIFDIPIDIFLQFCSIILNTDMVNAAMNMINYVKSKPYGINVIEIKDNNTKKGFFQN